MEAINPLISILIPIFNADKYLTRCLNSIKSQQFTDFEVILVDDGSTDTSLSICNAYALNDNRFKVIHKENEGIAKARLNLYRASSGKYIIFIDADDYLLPNALLFLFNEIEKGYDIVKTAVLRENSIGKQWIDHYPIEEGIIEGDENYIRNLILNKIHPYLHCAIYKADLFCDEVFLISSNNNINIGEDWIANYLISPRIHKILLTQQPTHVYCVHQNSTMKTFIRGWNYQHKINQALSAFNSQLNNDIKDLIFENSCLNRLKFFFLPEIYFNWKEYKIIEPNIEKALKHLQKEVYVPKSYLYFIHQPFFYFIYTRLYCLYIFIRYRKCKLYKLLN